MIRKLKFAKWKIAAVAVLLLCFVNILSAATFDDIHVNVVSTPVGDSSGHGYSEYEFDVINTSRTESHEVELVLPGNSYGGGGDRIGKLANKAVLAPNSRATITLLQPPVAMRGNDLAVVIDGRLQKDLVAVSLNDSSSMHYSYYGGGGVGRVVVLLSRGVSYDQFNDNAQEKLEADPAKSSYSNNMPYFSKSESEITRWSDNWLAYTRYSGVVVSENEMRQMPNGVARALDEYVRAGGTLTVIGEWELPQEGERYRVGPLETAEAGFGLYAAATSSDVVAWDKQAWENLWQEFWGTTSIKLQQYHSIEAANDNFPVVGDLVVSVKGMFTLVLVFAILIGPVNLFVLSKKKKRIWMLWTVPLISLIASVSVFAYSYLAEGWEGNIRICGITLLDQEKNLATTVGLAGFYSPLTPSGGLKFDCETEVKPMGLEDWQGGRIRMVDWSDGQRLYAGWVTARVPAHFMIRKSQLRRERIEIYNKPDGLSALNGLGADIEKFLYMDADGKIYSSEMVSAGDKFELKLTGDTFNGNSPKMRDVYSSSWHNEANHISEKAKSYLKPGSYIAVLNDSVFIEKAMENYKEGNFKSVVIGTLKGGNDEG